MASRVKCHGYFSVQVPSGVLRQATVGVRPQPLAVNCTASCWLTSFSPTMSSLSFPHFFPPQKRLQIPELSLRPLLSISPFSVGLPSLSWGNIHRFSTDDSDSGSVFSPGLARFHRLCPPSHSNQIQICFHYHSFFPQMITISFQSITD